MRALLTLARRSRGGGKTKQSTETVVKDSNPQSSLEEQLTPSPPGALWALPPDLMVWKSGVTGWHRFVGLPTVAFEDDSVADHFDACIDRGLVPRRFARIWIHTHPGNSPHPSFTDEGTFTRMFGNCDWSVMFIVTQNSRTYARLAFSVGPGGTRLLPVRVDWAAWPTILQLPQYPLSQSTHDWQKEYQENVLVRCRGGACRLAACWV